MVNLINMNKSKIVKKVTKPRVVRKIIEKPFADGSMTSNAFFSMIRAALRNKSRWYKSITIAKNRAKVAYIGPNKKRKWMYRCERCFQLHDGKSINVHHKIECGKLNSFEDLPGFVERLFCSSEHLIVLCNNCHDNQHEK